MKLLKQATGLALSLALLVSAWPGTGGQAAAAGKTSYTGYYGNSTADRTVMLKPKWQVQADYADGGASNIATADGNVYYSYKNKILAVNAATGKTKWTYASYRSTPLLARGGYVYFVDGKGYLIQLNGKTGAAGWKTKAAEASDYVSISLWHDKGTLYGFDAGGAGSIAAYDAATGKRKWKTKPDDSFAGIIQGVYDGVVVVSGAVSGAITTTPYFGFDSATGRQLWKLEGIHSDVLHEQDGYLYLRNAWPVLDNGFAAVIDKVDVKTGKIAKTLSYIPEEDTAGNNATSVVIDGKSIYIEQQPRIGMSKVSVFSLEREPEEQKPKIYEGRGKWLAGPYLGRLYFEANLKLIGIKDGGNGTLSFNGPENPISQLDLIGQGAFIGLTDGQFYLANAATGKVAGKLITGARQFGATKVESGMAIIQAEDRIYAVAMPSSLTK